MQLGEASSEEVGEDDEFKKELNEEEKEEFDALSKEFTGLIQRHYEQKLQLLQNSFEDRVAKLVANRQTASGETASEETASEETKELDKSTTE
mmetsp:Transcript_46218/g.74330  ORF Transcript_46218/g.74330 Transcript_46218/m.74330 type:complete len:93 (-) Transcript_46218:108-386(-)